ncbi:hypothetical protein NIES3806_09020 [Microcystis aeruginosa NIES-3806]|nr:hypothetical protein NIES3787_14700 [Microcystis aeruginosa NIES-3787]GCL53569.1 hypothetical protein NIES3806_09020 [Microcystis aeruginosa NIES-3806]
MAATFGLQKGLKVLSNNVFRFIQQTLLNHPIHTSKQVREY